MLVLAQMYRDSHWLCGQAVASISQVVQGSIAAARLAGVWLAETTFPRLKLPAAA